ncbi:MAG: glycosyltransferase family 2 protein [Candidatus Liptonbacteria bacterium]
MMRFFEIIPGALAWATLIGMVVFSWKFPAEVSVFIILFDIYWLLKTVYLSFHLRSTYNAMKENMKVKWLDKLKSETGMPQEKTLIIDPKFSHVNHIDQPTLRWEEIWHLVIFPMHNEPYEVVRESFLRLTHANYPKDKVLVVISVEESGGTDAVLTSEKIYEEFRNSFSGFLRTTHPAGSLGELPGKGSNEAWAARRAREELIDPRKIAYDKILVSVFDVDTQVFPEYLGRLTHAFIHAPNRLRAVYQPIPLFINNIFEAPALARIVSFSSSFWQMMQQARPERLTTFSSQSLPFKVLIDIGYWNVDVVSEDSRIFWQGYLQYHGDFHVVPLAYPVSMDANVAHTWWQTLKNIYKQQRRWGWGAENIPYMLAGFRTDPKIPRGKKWYWSFNVIEGFHSWATNALMIFALGWLPVMLGGHVFNETLLSYNLPRLTRLIVNISMLGISTTAVLAILLLPPKPEKFNSWHYFLYFIQWALIPVTLIAFGAFPGLEAQTRLMLGGKARLGFWVTPKGRYAKGEAVKKGAVV